MSDCVDPVATLLREGGPAAPPRLRARIEGEIERANARRSSNRPALAFAAGAAVASLVIAVVLFLPGLFAGPPDATDAHGLLSKGPAAPAPPRQADRPALLAAELEGVPFPDWQREFGWRAIGARSDELSGRRAESVFYEHEGHVIAYTIVSGEPLDVPPEATARRVNGVEIKQFTDGHGHDVVSFERDGKTCVLSGHVEHRSTLVELATWSGDGEIPF